MEAYRLYWEQYYNCLPRLSTIMAIDLNLEIIVDCNNTMLAFRYDVPEDMRWMVINSGQWQIVDEESLKPYVIKELKSIIIDFIYPTCKN